jgi:NAD+ diphosphatase
MYNPVTKGPLTYTVSPLDRAAVLRADEPRVQALLASGNARLVPVWNQKHLVDDTPRALTLSFAFAKANFDLAMRPPIFLGLDREIPWFALALPASETSPTLDVAGEFKLLNDFVGLVPGEEASILAYARALVLWHENHRHCSRCGRETVATESGHSRTCTNAACGHRTFPRTDPVVITLITRGDNCLLGRQAIWPPGMYSCIAGFVEPGETIESAVKREAEEETGVIIDDVRYVASQPWPFPASLMLGFEATATTTAINRKDQELEDCRWFSKTEIRAFGERNDPGHGFKLPHRFAIARLLIEGWLNR